LVISAPTFLASQNRFPSAFAGADIVCAPGPIVGDAWANLGFAEPGQIRVTGHLPLAPLLRGDQISIPPKLQGASAVVLYAPGQHPKMNSVEILGDEIVERIRGERDDVTLVIKPHPDMFADNPKLIERWAHAAGTHKHVILIDDPDADIMPYLKSADVLVSDVSSVIFDFLVVDRPIILLKNPEHASEKVGYDPQGVEWRWREVGREIHRIEDLARAVDLALKTPDAGKEVRERYRNALFGENLDGQSVERLIELVTELST